MVNKVENYNLKCELTLCKSLNSPLTIRLINLELIKQSRKINDCRLTFKVSREAYQHIDTEALFNLKPEIRGPISGGTFQPSLDIQIEASLDADLLPQLTKNAKTSNKAIAYLQNLSQEQPNHPLLSPYSWYALQVKQQQHQSEIGYRTLWNYLKPSDITQNGIDSKKLNEAMFDFAKEWANTDHSESSEEVISQTVEKINQSFEELSNQISEMTQEVVSESFEEMTNAFEGLVESISEITEEINLEKNIFETMVNFFKQEEWQFQKILAEPTLRLAFQGKNGKWECLAKAREKQQQMVFYSICSTITPESKCSTMAQFLTRANSGMVIGNFELDFASGEISYKTSIDVEGDRLTSALIQRVVYANVTMMDEYLPGILSVIYGNVSPAEAIATIEG
ncbi:MAG: YbjN domain-containing protein [Nostoc sp. DedQUE11]|nr:YbjN domain-containing protein [Nostoc sp. DedQUE11]